MKHPFWATWLVLILGGLASADGPGDNLPDKVRRVPPPGIKIPDSDRAELQVGVEKLGREIAALEQSLTKPDLRDLIPDVKIFHNAVRYALTYDEFYDLKEVPVAKKQLQAGLDRARELREGNPTWTVKTGLVVRGYVSKIDASVQPYGLVVPASFKPGTDRKFRLDFWCHGRGEKLTEVAFVQQRMNNPGEFTPPDTFVLHLYGRYCCANKFAGEVDLLEAYDNARKHYPIDPNRLVVRGFSMGGAACWQFAVHYADMFAAAAPGAGFSETPDFLKVFQNETVQPTDYEKKLWNLYDCPGYVVNLTNCPTVAYSGENDRQKQAADIMAKAYEAAGMKLTHIIGPKTGHTYHKEAKVEINKLIDEYAAVGRDPLPSKLKFATYTLRYHRMRWLTIDRLEEHWKQATVEGEILPSTAVSLTTRNVVALTLNFPARSKALSGAGAKIQIDGATINLPQYNERSDLTIRLLKSAGRWAKVESLDDGTVHKQHGLQGPVDDAFWDRFIIVKPTGKGWHEKTAAWTTAEMNRAIDHWRRQFRGEPIVKADTEITAADIASSNLILWGDPGSNGVLSRIQQKLPLSWTRETLQVNGRPHSVAANNSMPILIYPNPLNPKKYVVLNSGFTFRDYDYLNNARQVPKLPDWALIDLSVPPSSRFPGKVAAAGFFNEQWK